MASEESDDASSSSSSGSSDSDDDVEDSRRRRRYRRKADRKGKVRTFLQISHGIEGSSLIISRVSAVSIGRVFLIYPFTYLNSLSPIPSDRK